MINDDIQNQNAGDNSVNYQAKNITINQYGITEENAKDKLLQIFKENMPILEKIAADAARKSAEEIINTLIDKTIKLGHGVSDKIFKRMSEPDMQMAIIEAQKSYAKYADKSKLELFVELLIGKGKEERISLRNLLLDEAITTVSKMNCAQIDFLSYWIHKYVFVADIRNVTDLYEKRVQKILTYSYTLDALTYPDVDYLDQIGCIKRRPYKIVDNNIVDIILKQHGPVFGTNESVKRQLYQFNTNLENIIEKDLNLPSIDLMPLGILIGLKNIEIKTGDILTWNFN